MLIILRRMIRCSYLRCLPIVYGQDTYASLPTTDQFVSVLQNTYQFVSVGVPIYRVMASMRFGLNNMRRIVLAIVGNRVDP